MQASAAAVLSPPSTLGVCTNTDGFVASPHSTASAVSNCTFVGDRRVRVRDGGGARGGKAPLVITGCARRIADQV